MDNLNKESNDCEVEATNDQVTVSQSKRKSISIRQIFCGEMQKYTHSQIIALNSLICALIVLFVVFPIKIGPLDLAVIPIVAIIICTEILGLFNGMMSGLFFGLISLINHLIRPGLLSQIFIFNPLVTFLPRLLISVSVYFSIKLLGYLFEKIKYKNTLSKKITPKILDTIKYAVGGFLGVLTNTAGVLGLIYAFYSNSTLQSGLAITKEFIMGIVTTNSVIEAIVCTVLAPAITLAVKKTLSLTMRKK